MAGRFLTIKQYQGQGVFNWSITSSTESTVTIDWYIALQGESGLPTGTSWAIYETYVNFDGVEAHRASSNSPTYYASGAVLASGTKTFQKERDGSKKVSVDFGVGISNRTANALGNGTMVLAVAETLMASSVTCTSVAIGEEMTITITPYTSGVKHTIEYAFGDINETIVSDTTNTVITWTVPESMLHQITSSNYGNGTLYCYTFDSAGNYIGYSIEHFKIYVPEDTYKPVIEFRTEETDATVKALSKGNYFVKYMSDVKYTVTATAATGATIKSYLVTNGAALFESASETFVNVTDNVYNVTVVDSRGFTSTQSFTRQALDYIKITCNAKMEHFDPDDGTAEISINGNYFNHIFDASTENSITVTVDLIAASGTKTTLPATVRVINNTYTATVTFTGLDYKANYSVIAHANDKLTSADSARIAIASTPIFDWSKDDFRFNVPITKIGDYAFADFVIETGETAMGTNGTWYWRKWLSGKAECYGSRNFGKLNVTIPIYEGAQQMPYRTKVQTQALPEGLFVDTPEVIDIRLKVTGLAANKPQYGGHIDIIGEAQLKSGETLTLPSKDDVGSFVITFPYNNSTHVYPATHIGFNIVGRWK